MKFPSEVALLTSLTRLVVGGSNKFVGTFPPHLATTTDLSIGFVFPNTFRPTNSPVISIDENISEDEINSFNGATVFYILQGILLLGLLVVFSFSIYIVKKNNYLRRPNFFYETSSL